MNEGGGRLGAGGHTRLLVLLMALEPLAGVEGIAVLPGLLADAVLTDSFRRFRGSTADQSALMRPVGAAGTAGAGDAGGSSSKLQLLLAVL
jgi:hypothetical protein